MKLLDRPDLTEAERQLLPPEPKRRGRLVRAVPWLVVVGLLGAAAYWAYRAEQAAVQAPRAPRPSAAAVPVALAAAARRDVPVMLEGLGTVQALQSVVVRTQVDGQLLELPFTEGQEVAKGTVLARIDPRSFQAALAQALARKAQDEALLANAKLDLQRYQQLASAQGISRQQQDTQRALVAQYEAQVEADQAAIDAARTSLSYTTILAPIDGRVGLRQVDIGNIVHPGDANGIVTIAQIHPIAVLFTLPQQALPQLRAALAAGEVPVEATPPGGAAVQHGRLLTLDNQVDQATGTVRLKAVFDNDALLLWPGAFVSVRLRVATLQDALVVPLAAVQRGPDGTFAFVARPDGTVAQRPLVLASATGTLAVVSEGLAPGEEVVVSGATRLYDGAAYVVPGDPVRAPAQGQAAGRGARAPGAAGRAGSAAAPAPAAAPPAARP